MQKTKSTAVFAVALLMLCGSSGWGAPELSGAEKLIQHLPEDTIALFASSGSDHVKPAFDLSFMGQLCADPGVQSFVQTITQQALSQLPGDVATDQHIELIQTSVQRFMKYPMVFGLGQRPVHDETYGVYGFVIWDTGDQKAHMQQTLNDLMDMAGDVPLVNMTVAGIPVKGLPEEAPFSGYWGWQGNRLVLALNDPQGKVLTSLVSSSNKIVSALQAVPKTNDAFIMHVDINKLLTIPKAIMVSEGAGQEVQLFDAVLKGLGVDTIQSATVRLGFQGVDLVAEELVRFAGPPQGLFAAFRPIDLAVLDQVPAPATTVITANFDSKIVYDLILGTVQSVCPPEVFQEITQGITRTESQIGIDIDQQVLGNLAGPFTFYEIPPMAVDNVPMGGSALVAELKDAQAFAQSLHALGKFIEPLCQGQLQITQQETDGQTYTSWAIGPLAMAQVIPTWIIKDRQLVLGSSIPVCTAALEQIGKADAQASSVRGTQAFQQATTKLPPGLMSFTYTDSQAKLRQMTTQLQQVWPLACMGVTRLGIQLPFVLPNIDHIIAKTDPVCAYAWIDKMGIHSHYQGTGIEQIMAGAAGAGLGAGLLMPALSRTRQQAQHTVTLSQLKQIGLCCIMYAEENKGLFPPDLKGLVSKRFLQSKFLEISHLEDQLPGEDFWYVSGLTRKMRMPAQNAVAFVNPHTKQDKIGVVFMDGHVETVHRSQLKRVLERTYRHLKKEMPQPLKDALK